MFYSDYLINAIFDAAMAVADFTEKSVPLDKGASLGQENVHQIISNPIFLRKLYVTPLRRQAVVKGLDYLNPAKPGVERSIALNAVAAFVWSNHGWRPVPDHTLLYFQLLPGIIGRNGYGDWLFNQRSRGGNLEPFFKLPTPCVKRVALVYQQFQYKSCRAVKRNTLQIWGRKEIRRETSSKVVRCE